MQQTRLLTKIQAARICAKWPSQFPSNWLPVGEDKQICISDSITEATLPSLNSLRLHHTQPKRTKQTNKHLIKKNPFDSNIQKDQPFRTYRTVGHQKHMLSILFRLLNQNVEYILCLKDAVIQGYKQPHLEETKHRSTHKMCPCDQKTKSQFQGP